MDDCGGLENRFSRKRDRGSNPRGSVVSASSEKPLNPKGKRFSATFIKETTVLAKFLLSQSYRYTVSMMGANAT